MQANEAWQASSVWLKLGPFRVSIGDPFPGPNHVM